MPLFFAAGRAFGWQQGIAAMIGDE